MALIDIAHKYCIDNDIDELWTDNLCILHDIYELYRKSDTYKPLKVEHPLNALRAVRGALCRDKGKYFTRNGDFYTCLVVK